MVARQRQVDGFVERDPAGLRRIGRLRGRGVCSEGEEQREERGSKGHDASPVRACRAPAPRAARSRNVKGKLRSVAIRIKVTTAIQAISRNASMKVSV